MRTVQITTLDGPDALELTEAEEPAADPTTVLIDVHVAGVAFPEVDQSRGAYHLRRELPFVPGGEVAGIVRSAPAGSGLTPGQRVAAFVGVGGFAETVAAMPAAVFPLPDTVSFEVGAALPLNYLTMHFAFVRRARLAAGDTVLVHGAAGGLGTAAVDLASALGARVIAVVSDPAKADTARAAGAAHVVTADGFEEAVRALTDDRGVDIVVDPVGGDRLDGSLRSLAREGRLLVLGFTAGSVTRVDPFELMGPNVDVLGVGWGAFWAQDPDYLRQQWSELLPLLERDALHPVLGTHYPLEGATEALLELDQRRARGKVFLDIR